MLIVFSCSVSSALRADEVIGIDLGTTNSCVAVMEGKVGEAGVATEAWGWQRPHLVHASGQSSVRQTCSRDDSGRSKPAWQQQGSSNSSSAGVLSAHMAKNSFGTCACQ
jgi:hypothetical protein